MFLIFTSALIFGLVLYKLGTYSVIVSLFVMGIKFALVIAGIAIMVFLYKKYKGSLKLLNFPKG
jgi:hypothetical protein